MSKHPRLVIHNRKERKKKSLLHKSSVEWVKKKTEFNPKKKEGKKKIDQGLAVKECIIRKKKAIEIYIAEMTVQNKGMNEKALV